MTGNAVKLFFWAGLIFCACLVLAGCSSKESTGNEDLLVSTDVDNNFDEEVVQEGAEGEVFDDDSGIYKPLGTYSDFVGTGQSLEHEQALGGLVRVSWQELEPSNDVYNWQPILDQVERMDSFSSGKPWSLAIAGGKEAPSWLYDLGVESFNVTTAKFDEIQVPKFWDEQLQSHLADFAVELAARFESDERLILIYLPQMTLNGVEGHFNSVDFDVLENAGLTSERWIKAVKDAAVSFAMAFPSKPIAVELHDILGSSEIPVAIMDELWNDPQLEHRVGVAMWWISGDEQFYQQELLAALERFPGDIYGQVIGRSDQVDRFPEGYPAVFEQAKRIGMRYIEPWDYEFINFTQDEIFADFNGWANRTYD